MLTSGTSGGMHTLQWKVVSCLYPSRKYYRACGAGVVHKATKISIINTNKMPFDPNEIQNDYKSSGNTNRKHTIMNLFDLISGGFEPHCQCDRGICACGSIDLLLSWLGRYRTWRRDSTCRQKGVTSNLPHMKGLKKTGIW